MQLIKTCAIRTAAILVTAAAQPAFAHGGGPEAVRPFSWEDLAGAWEFDWGVVLPLLVSGWLYVFGVVRLWRATRVGCGIRVFEVSCFTSGWLALVVALVSPLHP